MSLDHASSYECPRQVPSGFSFVSELNRTYCTHHPETAQQYQSQDKIPPKPGEYSQSNGVLALVDYDGRMHVMLPAQNDNGMDRYKRAIAALDELGYIESSFMVPFS